MFIVTLTCSTLGPPCAVPSFRCVQCSCNRARMDAARLACIFSTAAWSPPLVRAAVIVMEHWRFRTGPSRASTWATCKTLFNQKRSWVARGLPLSVHWTPLIEGLLRLFRVTFGQVDSGVRKISFIPSTRQDCRRFKMRKIARLEYIPVWKSARIFHFVCTWLLQV